MSSSPLQKKSGVIADPYARSTKVAIMLRGKEYLISCSEEDADRLSEIVDFLDEKMEEIAHNNENASESRLMLLTCLTLADDLIDLKRAAGEQRAADEDLYVAAVEHLSERVAQIARQVGRA